jgi:C1A family cysteine protease
MKDDATPMNPLTPRGSAPLVERSRGAWRLVAAVVLALAMGTAWAQAADEAVPVQSTGLRPPSAEERVWMEANLSTTRRVLPNALALERINRQRQSKGLAEVETRVVPVGAESSEESTPECPAGMDLGAVDAAHAKNGTKAVLPAAVDNSALPSFPPVRSQGSLGSCAAFSTTYYAGTHMTGLARGWHNRDNADNTRKLSPKWSYNFANGGNDAGSWFSTIMDVMLKLGAPSWSEFPYVGDNTNPANYLEWSQAAAVWRSAAGNRFQQIGRVQAVDTGSGLANLKALLADGYAILYATHVFSWQFMPFGDDPATTTDNALVGRQCCWKVSAEANSGHAMTVVGYNDDVWTDINKNGTVDSGEKGALKVVNSWGLTGWGQAGSSDGFGWIAYDALKSASGVHGVGSTNRQAGFWFSEVYWITARASYTPTLLGQFTLSSARRNQLSLKVGSSATTSTTPAATFPPTTVFGWQNSSDTWPQALNGLGGAYGFTGGSTAVSGTFALDLSDLVQSGSRRYYVSVQDTAWGSAATLSDFRLVTPSGTVLATAVAGIPGTADNSTALAYADFAVGAAPTITSAATASGTVGLPFSYSITASNSPTSFAASGLPDGLTVNTGSGAIAGTPTQAGAAYVVGLSAANANGVGTGAVTITISSQAIATPTITSPVTATGMVGQAFSYSITASNSPTSFAANGLPNGLTVHTSTGAIDGTPTQAGTFTVMLSATNAGGTGTGTLTLSVNPAPALVPQITSASSASGVSSSAFSYRILATNSPIGFGATGLPVTLELNSVTGDISGVLPAPGSYSITLSAANGNGTGYQDLLLTVTGSSIYGPPNDAFANRIALTGVTASARGTNENASAESGEPAHAGFAAARSVWWTWTAPASGPVTIQTVGSDFDTLLAAYTGNAVNALTLRAGDDDSGGDRASRIVFEALAGTTYSLAVDGYAGATGEIALALSQTPVAGPANDLFANRAALTGASASASGANHGAASEAGEPAHAGYAASRSVWWTWTAPAAGQVTIDTIGSDFDTLLAVYTGTTLNALTPVAADDQSGGNNTSLVTFLVTAGTPYQIAVDGWYGRTGGVQLHLALGEAVAANDPFAGRILLLGNVINTAGSNIRATAESGEPEHAGYAPRRSVWWTWTAGSTGIVTLDTEGSGFDTLLAVYRGGALANLVPVAANDDGGAGVLTSRLQFYATAGTTYQIAVDGYAGASGSIALHLTLAVTSPNDAFANRLALVGSGVSTTGGNVGASAEVGEPSHHGYAARRSVWWTWTAPAAGMVVVTTAGSSFDTVLAVYRGSTLSSLVAVASDDDAAGGLTSQATFYATAGTVFQIAVDGFSGSEGRIELALSQTASSVLYSTDFEGFPAGVGALDTHDGWRSTDADASGSSGVVSANTQMGWIGFNPTAAETVYVFRPVNYDPVAAGTPLIQFSVDWAVHDSTFAAYDRFGFALFNTVGDYLALILFDNATMDIHRADGSGTLTPVGAFANARTYRLQAFLDFAANRWSATLDGAALFTDQVLHAGGAALTLGDMDAFWAPRTVGSPGDNYMVFDNYRLALGGREGPAISTVSPLPGGTVGVPYSRTMEATGGATPYVWSLAAGSLPPDLALSSTGVLSGTPRSAGTASFSVRVTGGNGMSSSEEFTLTIARGAQTITVPALPATTYGAADFVIAATASSGLALSYTSSNPAVATVAGASVHIAGVGTAALTASQGGDANWSPAAEVQRTLAVGPAPLTIVADNLGMVVGGPLPALTATYTGLVGGDTPASLDTAVTLATPATAASPPGTYPIHASGATDANYTIAHVDGVLTVYAAAHTVVFLAGPNGWLEGDTTQTVAHGGSTTAVAAYAPYGFVFDRWSDGSTENPRTLSNVAADATLTATFRTAGAFTPTGQFLALVDAPGRGIWDLSGGYLTAVADSHLTMALAHDSKGKLGGTATITFAKATIGPMPVRGTVKGSAGAVTVRLTMRGADAGQETAAALTLTLALDHGARRLAGAAVGTIEVGGRATPVSTVVALDLPAPMDGSWGLSLQLWSVMSATTGTARLTLSNAVEYTSAVKGKVRGNATVLSSAGAPADPAARGIRIKVTVIPLEGGWATVQSFCGRAYGQALFW